MTGRESPREMAQSPRLVSCIRQMLGIEPQLLHALPLLEILWCSQFLPDGSREGPLN
jgi:hypothetical protein